MRILYISGPYRAPTVKQISANIRHAREWAKILWAEGYSVICPHANSAHMDACVPAGTFLAGDIAIISRLDAQKDMLFMLNGWRDSEGAKAEYLFALQKGLTIVYEKDYKVCGL